MEEKKCKAWSGIPNGEPGARRQSAPDRCCGDDWICQTVSEGEVWVRTAASALQASAQGEQHFGGSEKEESAEKSGGVFSASLFFDRELKY